MWKQKTETLHGIILGKLFPKDYAGKRLQCAISYVTSKEGSQKTQTTKWIPKGYVTYPIDLYRSVWGTKEIEWSSKINQNKPSRGTWDAYRPSFSVEISIIYYPVKHFLWDVFIEKIFQIRCPILAFWYVSANLVRRKLGMPFNVKRAMNE